MRSVPSANSILPGHEFSLWPAYLPVDAPANSHSVAILVSQCHSTCQITLILFNNVPKVKSNNVVNPDMPKRSQRVLPISERVCMYREKYAVHMSSVLSVVLCIHWVSRSVPCSLQIRGVRLSYNIWVYLEEEHVNTVMNIAGLRGKMCLLPDSQETHIFLFN